MHLKVYRSRHWLGRKGGGLLRSFVLSMAVDELFLISTVPILYVLALPPRWYTAWLLDRTRLIARQVAFFNSTRIKIKLRHLTRGVKLEIVIAARLNGVS